MLRTYYVNNYCCSAIFQSFFFLIKKGDPFNLKYTFYFSGAYSLAAIIYYFN